MRIPPRSLGVLALAGALLLGTTGCGSGDGPDGGDTDFDRALAAAPAAASDESVTFQKVGLTRKLVARESRGHSAYTALANLGVPELGTYTGDPLRDWGFDQDDVQTSLNLGSQATRLTGTFDTDAVSDAMTKRGYRSSEANSAVRLTKQGEATVDVTDSVRTSNAVDSKHRLPLRPPEKSLADDEEYRAVSDCLGDVYEATVYGRRMSRNPDVSLLGIGGRYDAGKHSSAETLCALSPSRKAAEATAEVLREGFAAPGKQYAGSKVTIGEGDTPIVSMTWKNSTKSGMGAGQFNQTLTLPSALLKIFS